MKKLKSGQKVVIKRTFATRVGETGHCSFCGGTHDWGWANESERVRICDKCLKKLKDNA